MLEQIKLLAIAAVLPLSLTGCLTPKKPLIVVTPIERVPLTLPNVDSINTKEVEWTIITVENYEDVFYNLQKNKVDGAIFGLTDQGYVNLSENIAAIRKLVQQQQAIIIAYEKYYKQQSQKIEEHNNKAIKRSD